MKRECYNLKKCKSILSRIYNTFINRYRKLILTVLFLFSAYLVNATTYYLSSSGNDRNSGTREDQPWKSLSKVNRFVFLPSDKILFRRGDEWTGTIKVNASGIAGNPIIYSSYGEGANPIISGFTTITSGWKNEGGGIYSISVLVESAPQMVTIDGVQYAMGRWPNTGWRTITGASGSTQITDSGLIESLDWAGAEIVTKTSRWTIEKRTILSHSTTQLIFAATVYAPKINWGYFIQGNLNTLDTYGEWYFNMGTSTFYMYFGENDPTTKTVKVSAIDKGIVSANRAYIMFDSLSITGMNTKSIYLYPTPAHTIVQNCDISFSGGDGIHAHYPSNCSVLNSTFNYTNSGAIWFHGNTASNNSITNNNISNTGLIAGTGSVEGASYNAIYSIGTSGAINHNSISNTGYLPIYYGGENTVVQNNYIDTYCKVLDDGGGIYCFNDQNTGKQVLNNIVLNAIGAMSGTNSTTSSGNGLYADGNSKHIHYSGNTVAYISKFGFHSNLPEDDADITIFNNTFFEVSGFVSMQRWNAGYTTGIRITNNEVFSTDLSDSYGIIKYNVSMNGQDLPFYKGSLIDEVSHIGIIDSNYYYTNIDNAAYVYSSAPHPSYTNYTNNNWKSKFNFDASSTYTTGISDPHFYQFEYNATLNKKKVELTTPMIDVKGTKYRGSINLQPFTSLVLMKDLTTPAAD